MAKDGAEKAEEKRIEEELEKLFKETDRISRASFARKKLRRGLRQGGSRR